jgi:RHH-type proline utilization regulon transcriptional repressor/proline dehydrogenase/delta 1-pyrroline-5-carboxylate dehydrogenase
MRIPAHPEREQIMAQSTSAAIRHPQTAEIETLTRRIGKEIFSRVGVAGPVPFSPSWWDDRLMGLSMANEAVKFQMFRFVDVLPQLQTPASIVEHLREYFDESADHLPRPALWALRLLPGRGPLAGALAAAVRWGARRLARKFIAGSNIPEAVQAVSALRQRSLAFTVDLLGEATITETEAVKAQFEYLELITGLSRSVNSWTENSLIDRDDQESLPRVNVSVKLSALYSQFDPIDPDGTSRAVRARLRPILRAARQNRAFVNFDMEQYSFKDTTLQIFEEILSEDEFRDWPDAGIAIQAYLRDTAADLERLAAWARKRGTTAVGVRLVKGAYWDYETVMAAQLGWPVPVWLHKWESDAAYERLTAFLLENRRWLRPALGSHNVRSIAHALALARAMKLPPGSVEIQMLYGMAEPIKDALVDMGYRVRVYTPYGELLPGMAYLVRRLLENTANESFLRASFSEHVGEDQLLRDPGLVGAVG